MAQAPTAGGPPELVEHFFRHESAHLVAVLTRAFGVRYLDMVEDTVQEALLAAMETWGRQGVPANPSGWIYRVARNRMLDRLRRGKTYQRVLGLAKQTEDGIDSLITDWLQEEHLPDSLLRMIFVCCHPALDRRSRLAVTLKILCGFSLNEIARGLLISPEAAKKRVQRAKKTLADQEIQVELPPPDDLPERLGAVQEVLYLLFNEGYSATEGAEPLRDDICEEAARLCHLLANHESFGTPETRALLALMLAHSARLEARTDTAGGVVLLAEQDRSRWDRRLIAHAESWLARSKTANPGRFHYEAAISLVHCHAASASETDWPLIVQYYDRLLAIHDSPLYRLNRAIARAEAGEIDRARTELQELRQQRQMRGYYLLDCALGRLHELDSNPEAAIGAYKAALAATRAVHEQALLGEKLRRLKAISVLPTR